MANPSENITTKCSSIYSSCSEIKSDEPPNSSDCLLNNVSNNVSTDIQSILLPSSWSSPFSTAVGSLMTNEYSQTSCSATCESNVSSQETTTNSSPWSSADPVSHQVTILENDNTVFTNSTVEQKRKEPLVLVVIGMAGSGKTTFVKSFYEFLRKHKKRVYTINLDPAVLNVPYPANIDICDTIKCRDVMIHYMLGPNGAIMTSLNLFSTHFDKVMNLLEKRAPKLDYVLIDTPGQIEVFNWSASGSIILDSLSVTFPTVIIYIIDTPRSIRPITFMSNMMYACSVLYKTRLPFIICFNKIDIVSHKQCIEWMTDYESYADTITNDSTYMASLSRSCALLLFEFYKEIFAVGVSAATTQGYYEVIKALDKCKYEYYTEFMPWIESRKDEINKKRQSEEKRQMKRLERDMSTKQTF